MKRITRTGLALAALAMAGCAAQTPMVTSALKPKGEAAQTSSADRLRAWCAQRHVDYQAGKAPGGAKTLEQKQADDRRCEGAN